MAQFCLSGGEPTIVKELDEVILAMQPDKFHLTMSTHGHFLTKEKTTLQKIQNHIKHIGDLERLISKVATGKVNPREVIQLKNSLEAIVPIKAISSACNNQSLKIIGDTLQSCDVLREKIKETLNEEAPVNVLKGHTIAPGFSSELDELRGLSKSGKNYLDSFFLKKINGEWVFDKSYIMIDYD